MAKVRVQRWGKVGANAYAEVDTAATDGAVVGRNLYLQDGTLVTYEMLFEQQQGDGSGDLEFTYWKLIREVPANVRALAGASGAGLFAVTGAGTGAFREVAGTSGQIDVANGSGVGGDPTVALAAIGDAGGGEIRRFDRDAFGRVSGTSAATTTHLPEGTNLYYTDARADARIEAQKGQPNGLATLDANAKLDAGQLPALAITETFVVPDEAAMLALDVQQGDVAVRSDEQKSYILTAEPASTLANWQELLTPTGVGVASFNGRTGSVVPASGDYTPAQVGAEPAIAAGTTSQYWRGDKSWRDFATDVRTAVLTGLSTATNAAIAATDTVLQALGKLQAQITARVLKSGDTMTGDLSIARAETNASSAPSLIVSNTAASATNEAHYDMISDGLLARIYWRKAASPTLGYYIDLNDGSGAQTRLRFTTAGWNVENANLSVSGNKVMDAADAVASGLLSFSPTVSSLDAVVGSTARFFRWVSGATGQPISAGGVGLYIPYSSTQGAMWAHAFTSNRMFMRGYNSGSWSAWKEITAT